MVNLDHGRLEDLEQLSAMLREPWKFGLSQKGQAEVKWTIQKIIHQSAPIKSLRDKLIQATRAGDTKEIRKIQEHIHAINMEESRGHDFY